MIFTKLRLLACLSLACLASNVDAECSRVTGSGMLYTMWNKYVGTPLTRRMEFNLNFDGTKCQFSRDFGPGPYIQSWSGASDDGRCIVGVDTLKNYLMVRYDGNVFGGPFTPEETSGDVSSGYVEYQQIWYRGINFSNGC